MQPLMIKWFTKLVLNGRHRIRNRRLDFWLDSWLLAPLGLGAQANPLSLP